MFITVSISGVVPCTELTQVLFPAPDMSPPHPTTPSLPKVIPSTEPGVLSTMPWSLLGLVQNKQKYLVSLHQLLPQSWTKVTKPSNKTHAYIRLVLTAMKLLGKEQDNCPVEVLELTTHPATVVMPMINFIAFPLISAKFLIAKNSWHASFMAHISWYFLEPE